MNMEKIPRNTHVVALRHGVMLALLAGLAFGIYWFICAPDRVWAAATKEYQYFFVTDSRKLPQEPPFISDRTRIFAGTGALGLVGAGVIGVFRSWKRSLK
jgi:hypothetical protein